MKKGLIIITIVFLITGCTTSLSSTLTIDECILNVLSNPEKFQNTNGIGYRYYKPRDFSVIEDNEFNQTLLSNGYNYYLNIDLNAYYNKYRPSYVTDSELYLSYKFTYNNIDGYVEIIDGFNGYFYIKMLYNYSSVEVSVKESDIKKAVIDSSIILSSIKYNDNVIEKLISSRDLDSKESPFEIAKPKDKTDDKNILDYATYDQYTE